MTSRKRKLRGRRMATKRPMRKRKSWSRLLSGHPLHPLWPSCHPNEGGRMALALTLLLLMAIPDGFVQAASQKQTHSHADDFLIFATLFDGRGFALPGAKVRVRRADETKFRWEAISDRRGELGIRVKQGAYRFSGLDPNIDYEIHAEREGLTSATRSISSFDTRKDVSMTLKLDRK